MNAPARPGSGKCGQISGATRGRERRNERIRRITVWLADANGKNLRFEQFQSLEFDSLKFAM